MIYFEVKTWNFIIFGIFIGLTLQLDFDHSFIFIYIFYI